jgi:hypothetical protein
MAFCGTERPCEAGVNGVCGTERLCEAGVNGVLWHRETVWGRCEWRFVAQRGRVRQVWVAFCGTERPCEAGVNGVLWHRETLRQVWVAFYSAETLVGLCEAAVNGVLWHRDRLVGLWYREITSAYIYIIMLAISLAGCIITNEYVSTVIAFHSYSGTSVIRNHVNSNWHSTTQK